MLRLQNHIWMIFEIYICENIPLTNKTIFLVNIFYADLKPILWKSFPWGERLSYLYLYVFKIPEEVEVLWRKSLYFICCNSLQKKTRTYSCHSLYPSLCSSSYGDLNQCLWISRRHGWVYCLSLLVSWLKVSVEWNQASTVTSKVKDHCLISVFDYS